MKTIDHNEFAARAKGQKVLVVQFSATWCAPCKTLTKTIEDNEDKFTNPIYKMDLDANAELASVLGIRSVPTLIRFENEQEVKRVIGNQNFEQLLELTV
jgi:thioredoxin 1